MFVSKKKYKHLLELNEQLEAQNRQQEWLIDEWTHKTLNHGGPYKCIQECRQTALALSHFGLEEPSVTLSRLAYIDFWLSHLTHSMSKMMSDSERLLWECELREWSVRDIYGATYCHVKEVDCADK